MQMEPWRQEIGLFLAEHFWAVCGVACLALRAFWRLWIRTRYFAVVLERLGAVSSSRENALAERITDRLLKAFFKAPKPTLESLANDTTTPWNLRPSTASSPKPDGSS